MMAQIYFIAYLAICLYSITGVTSCVMPTFAGSSYSIVDDTPNWINIKATIAPTAKSSDGWAVIVIFTSSVPSDVSIDSKSAILSAESSDRRALTFINRDFNKDISKLQQFSFTFSMERQTDLPNLYMGLVGFYEAQVSDGSCFLEPNPVEPNPVEPDLTTTTTTTSPTTTTSSTSTASSSISSAASTTVSPASSTASGTSPTVSSALTSATTLSTSSVDDTCSKMPLMHGTSYSVVEQGVDFSTIVISFSPTAENTNGWSTIIVFTDSLPPDITIGSYSVDLSAISNERRVMILTNKIYNADLSNRMTYSFAMYLFSSEISSMSMTALVGYIGEKMTDASCYLILNPISPISTTSSSSSTTITTPATTSSISASTTSSSTSTILPTTTTRMPAGCKDVDFTIDNNGWPVNGDWNFIFRIQAPISDYSDWTVKIVFSKPVTFITSNHVEPSGPHAGGQVWLLGAKSWNSNISNQELNWTEIAFTSGDSAPTGDAILCNNGVVPDTNLPSSS